MRSRIYLLCLILQCFNTDCRSFKLYCIVFDCSLQLKIDFIKNIEDYRCSRTQNRLVFFMQSGIKCILIVVYSDYRCFRL